MYSQLNDYANIVTATTYDHACRSPQVFNFNKLQSGLIVHLPEDLSFDIDLLHITEFGEANSSDIHEQVSREDKKPWIDIPSTLLNLSIGLHIYALDFSHTRLKDPLRLFVSYIVQKDFPKQDYIYMER